MIRRRNILIVILLFVSFSDGLCVNGRFLVVGGGSEKNGLNSWSTAAYTWATQNGKVAIIGMETTGGYVSYFMNQCNARYVREFAITTRDSANSQATFDTLKKYDFIFFRGGDQYAYYLQYKGTRLLEAADSVYHRGGAIGGTSAGLHVLSEIVYTAQRGSVYPYECIENPNNQYVTLANDYMHLFPGYVFDSHVAERGRFARTLTFVANWKLNHSEMITGLGMDDMTCMAIDENLIGTVYGTGAANIYRAVGSSAFSLGNGKLLADSVEVIQLLHGCTFDFNSGQAGTGCFTKQLTPPSLEETGNFTLFATGSDNLADNTTMLTAFSLEAGLGSDTILILTGSDMTLAESFRNQLLVSGASHAVIGQALAANGESHDLGKLISEAGKILFVKNDWLTLEAFLATTNGTLLSHKIREPRAVLSFAGNNARFAGHTVIENYLTSGASYYAELTFQKGLNLLNHTVIMPDTYLNSNIYENTTTAVPYVMVNDTLRYGIWLYKKNWVKYHVQDSATWLNSYGTSPVMILQNSGTSGGVSQHTSSGNPGSPRMVGGFGKMTLTLADETTPFKMGNHVEMGIPSVNCAVTFSIIPNPASGKVTITGIPRNSTIMVFDMTGKRFFSLKDCGEQATIDFSDLNKGPYLIRVANPKVFNGFSTQVLIKE